jgi:hypothetical protein
MGWATFGLAFHIPSIWSLVCKVFSYIKIPAFALHARLPLVLQGMMSAGIWKAAGCQRGFFRVWSGADFINLHRPLTNVHMYIHVYMCTYMCTYVPTCVHVYLHVYICTYMCTYVPTCAHMYMHMCVNTYVHAYVHKYICTCHIFSSFPLTSLF